MNERVREIKLPVAGTTTAAGTMAVVSGWGNVRVSITKRGAIILSILIFFAQNNGIFLPLRLQSANVAVVENQDCKTRYSPLNMTITDKMLCAGGNGRQDSCQVLKLFIRVICFDF